MIIIWFYSSFSRAKAHHVEVKHTDTQTKDRQSYSAELMSNPIFLGDFTFTGKEFMR